MEEAEATVLSELSPGARAILAALARERNVLVSGPPGTGKTHVLSEIDHAFTATTAGARIDPVGPIPVPLGGSGASVVLPSPDRPHRRVFRTVFHQNSKLREFVSGLVPATGSKAEPGTFVVHEGTLLTANDWACREGHAALLIIDEINRGPAVQIFGGSLVAIEHDKRLGDDAKPTPSTVGFPALRADGEVHEVALSPHLYLLAAMNQADTSVEPLDVAFLRRWFPIALNPDPAIARRALGVADHFDLPKDLPSSPSDPANYYAALVAAWEAVNDRISLGRGPELRFGHGPLVQEPRADLDEAVLAISAVWDRLLLHVEEIFFGDARGVAAALGAYPDVDGHPLQLETTTFADEVRERIKGSLHPAPHELYGLLRAVAGAP